MAVQTAKFEAATITTFYYAIEKGSNLSPNGNEDLREAMEKEYPGIPEAWYLSALKDAQELLKYLGYSEGNRDNSWKYAHFDGETQVIPRGDTTDVINYIWDSFDKKQKDVFKGKKDSWNTADVYMVKKSDEDKIKRNVNNLIGEFKDLEPSLLIGTVNSYMGDLLKKKILLPISLKAPTPNAAVKITETNVYTDTDALKGAVGKILTPLYTNMALKDVEKGKKSFDTNSLTFDAEFESGNIKKIYSYESKQSSVENHATEPRDKVLNLNTKKYIKAKARNGAIPAPKMAELVKEYTKEKINHIIPIRGGFSSAQISYWKKYIKDIVSKKDKNVPVNLGKMSIDGKKLSPENFIEQSISLDGGKAGGKNYDQQLRGKLRILRYIKMFLMASKSKKLPELITKVYFTSSKINFKEDDLGGPFIKIQ